MEKQKNTMPRFCITGVAVLFTASCTSEVIETFAGEQVGMQVASTAQEDTQLQGTQLQGTQLQGMTMQGFQFAEATLGGVSLMNLRIERGEVVAEQDGVTLRGASLAGAHLYAQVANLDTDPPVTALVEYRITDIAEEDAKYDPTYSGSTFLYTLEQNVDNAGSWQPACPADLDGRRAAIPLAATWNQQGDRIESSSLFTFGCTTGVIAKCYRWGYRPWMTDYGDLAAVHWACTRLARADYCGDGVSHTHNGTWVDVWDNLPAPGPIQTRGAHPPHGMSFEAGWNTEGAVCLSRPRWKNQTKAITEACPSRVKSAKQAKKFCQNEQEALHHGLVVLLFNDSFDDPLHAHFQ